MENKQIIPPQLLWSPLINKKAGMPSSQMFALLSDADEMLLWGTRGSGKTIVQLMCFAVLVGCGYGEYLKCLFFDMSYKSLEDAVSQSRRYFPKLGGRFLRSAQEYKWVFPAGEQLVFRHFTDTRDYNKVHGHEYSLILANELTKHKDSQLYDALRSVNRTPFDPHRHTPQKYNYYGEPLYKKDGSPLWDTPDGELCPPLKCRIISTTNPSGAGRSWVKQRFIDPSPSGVPVVTKTMVDGREVTRTQVSIASCWIENLKANGGYLDDAYVANLMQANTGNKNILKAWVYGSWDISAGGAFDDLWDSSKHIAPRFKIPYTWRIDRSMDWGNKTPFSICWWAEADGTQAILENGQRFTPPAGTLFQIYEWYGSQTLGTDKGLGLSATDVAKGVNDIEKNLLKQAWIMKKPVAGPADTQISSSLNSESPSIKKFMEKEGVFWTDADKSNGSRISGVNIFRERLQNSIYGEGAGVYFMNNCKASLHFIPHLPTDPKNIEDVDTKCEEHVWDSIRYRCLSLKTRVQSMPVIGMY